MIVKATKNNLLEVDPSLMEYAVSQDENGIVDISINKHYEVYGVKQDKEGTWYLVFTDANNIRTPWWMPAALYEVVDSLEPNGWKTQIAEGVKIQSYPILFDPETENDLMDGDIDAMARLIEAVESDSTFPTEATIDQYNTTFSVQRQQEKYEEELRLAKENGYERPTKPATLS